MTPALIALAEELKAKRTAAKSLFDAHKQTDGTYNFTAAQRDDAQAKMKEIDELGAKFLLTQADAKLAGDNDAAIKAMGESRMPAPFSGQGGGIVDQYGRPAGPAVKSLGEQFTENAAFKSFSPTSMTHVNLPEFDVKTLFQTTAGWAPFVERRPGIVLSAQQQPKVVDLIPAMQTTQAAIKWMLETTYTNNAAEAAEGGAYAESVFATAEQTTAVNKIAVTLPATDEQVADVPASRDYINNRLSLNLRQRFDLQLLVGNGTAPNFKGINNVSGIQTLAQGTSPVFDAFLNAIVAVQATAFANPSGAVINPFDWAKIRLMRTTDGLYIMGNPSDMGAAMMWGIPFVPTTYQTAGTGLVGDWQTYSELWYRLGITFDWTNANAAEFLSGIQRFRGSMRAAFVVTRPAAFCAVTGIH
jgi:HK97 family phage major capsid protein